MIVNIEKNNEYYCSDKPELCDCDYCKKYIHNIKTTYPAIDKYLSEISIDIQKPFELGYIEHDKNTVEYLSCQYVVFGQCEDNFSFKIDDVEFSKSTVHPDTNITEEHFVLEFGPITMKNK